MIIIGYSEGVTGILQKLLEDAGYVEFPMSVVELDEFDGNGQKLIQAEGCKSVSRDYFKIYKMEINAKKNN